MKTFNRRDLSGNFVTRYVSTIMTDMVPRKLKRLLYIGSILYLVYRDREITSYLMEKISHRLKVSFTGGVLPPAYFCESIWENVDMVRIPLGNWTISITHLRTPPEQFDQDSCLRLGLYFARNSPDWIRYGSEDLMTLDATDLFKVMTGREQEAQHGHVQ